MLEEEGAHFPQTVRAKSKAQPGCSYSWDSLTSATTNSPMEPRVSPQPPINTCEATVCESVPFPHTIPYFIKLFSSHRKVQSEFFGFLSPQTHDSQLLTNDAVPFSVTNEFYLPTASFQTMFLKQCQLGLCLSTTQPLHLVKTSQECWLTSVNSNSQGVSILSSGPARTE